MSNTVIIVIAVIAVAGIYFYMANKAEMAEVSGHAMTGMLQQELQAAQRAKADAEEAQRLMAAGASERVTSFDY